MKTENKIWLVVVFAIVMTCSLVSGYAGGHLIGESLGYRVGYDIAMAIVDDYPQATFKGYTINIDGGGTFSFEELTVQGEQGIIDFVSNVPEIKRANGGVEVSVGEARIFSKSDKEVPFTIIDGVFDSELESEAEYHIIPDEAYRMNEMLRNME